MDSRVIAGFGAAAAVGSIQAPLLREYVDKEHPTLNIPVMKGFGTPSALAGIGLGIPFTIVGLYGASTRKMRDEIAAAAMGYGIPAAMGGIASGLAPAVTKAVCEAKGGFWYNDACHKTAATTTSMGAPQVQTSYRGAADMSVLQRMTAELQRLAQENAQLRAMQSHQAAPSPAIEVTQVIPGTVKRRQGDYGFMAETQQPLAGPRTAQIKKRYDFMG